MSERVFRTDRPAGFSRRNFLKRAGAFVLATSHDLVWVQSPNQAVLSGTEFDLRIGAVPVNLTGVLRKATLVNGQLPAPLLRMRQGDFVTWRVWNDLPVRSSIHWHGLIVPADMDGVPGISFEGISKSRLLYVPLQSEPVRHVLVPLALAFPGAHGTLWTDCD